MLIYSTYHIYFRNFGLGGDIRDDLILWFLWCILRWNFSRGLTRENKTTVKIAMYTVPAQEVRIYKVFQYLVLMKKILMDSRDYNCLGYLQLVEMSMSN